MSRITELARRGMVNAGGDESFVGHRSNETVKHLILKPSLGGVSRVEGSSRAEPEQSEMLSVLFGKFLRELLIVGSRKPRSKFEDMVSSKSGPKAHSRLDPNSE